MEQKSPNYRQTIAYRQKMSEALKGRILSDEWRRKISNSLKGRTYSDETKHKMSKAKKGMRSSPLTEFKKGQSAPNKGKIIDKARDELNCRWKGDDVSYSGLHHWLKRRIPKTGYCDYCSKQAKRTELARIDKEVGVREITNYAELCVSCHRNYDAGNYSIILP